MGCFRRVGAVGSQGPIKNRATVGGQVECHGLGSDFVPVARALSARGFDLAIRAAPGQPHVRAGDAMILPAGVGHCRCDKSDDFQICGGYPSDQPHATVIRAPDERRPDHVDQIAEAADVSPRTFFRYFPTKESVLFSDDLLGPIIEAFLAAPPELSTVAAYRHAVAQVFASLAGPDFDYVIAMDDANLDDLLALLGQDNPLLQYWGLLALGGSDLCESCFDDLRYTMGEEHPSYVRTEAAAILAKHDQPDGLTHLRKTLKDPDPDTVLRAARALELLAVKARPAIADMHATRDKWKAVKEGSIPMFIWFSLETALQNLGEQVENAGL